MKQTNWPTELRKRGLKLTPLHPLTSEQMEHIQKISQDVNKFLQMMEKARKTSEKSTLRFAKSAFIVAQHGQRSSPSLNTQKQR